MSPIFDTGGILRALGSGENDQVTLTGTALVYCDLHNAYTESTDTGQLQTYFGFLFFLISYFHHPKICNYVSSWEIIKSIHLRDSKYTETKTDKNERSCQVHHYSKRPQHVCLGRQDS